jgi:DNA-directed RNA polymerase specialized sigma24 family protein
MHDAEVALDAIVRVGFARAAEEHSMTGWLPRTAELDAFEGIRRGEEDAFRALAEPLQPSLRRLARLYVEPDAHVDAVVLRGWSLALGGVDMFRWHTLFATWIAGITVAVGRAHTTGVGAAAPAPITSAWPGEVLGPADWSDLPWSARWEQAGSTLVGALAALPLDQREVVHGREVERWPARRVCDVFGLPEAAYEQLLAEARTRLRDALGCLVGQVEPGSHRDAQIAAVSGWLGQRLDDRPEPLDPRAVAVFHRWSATRHRGWKRLGRRWRTSDRSSSERSARHGPVVGAGDRGR